MLAVLGGAHAGAGNATAQLCRRPAAQSLLLATPCLPMPSHTQAAGPALGGNPRAFGLSLADQLAAQLAAVAGDVQGRRWLRARDGLQGAPVLDAQQLVASHSHQLDPQLADALAQLVASANTLWRQVAPHAGVAGPPASPPASFMLPPPPPFVAGQPFMQHPYMQPQVPMQQHFVYTHAPPPPPPAQPHAGAQPQAAAAEAEEGFGEQFQASWV